MSSSAIFSIIPLAVNLENKITFHEILNSKLQFNKNVPESDI